MPSPQELTNRYLKQRMTMQLATISDDGPWICTVRFVTDDQQNLYWASIPSRRHSQDIADNPEVACAIVVQDELDKPVIGIQIEGRAERLQVPLADRAIVEQYAKKFGRDELWIKDFIAGNTEHRLYKLTPSAIYLFDEQNFPGGQKQQVL